MIRFLDMAFSGTQDFLSVGHAAAARQNLQPAAGVLPR
jgi:hypothetical protein